MKSKKSFFSKILFINDIKIYGWLGLVYGFFLFITMTLPIITEYIKEEALQYFFRDLFMNYNFPIRALMVTVPVVMAIVLFRYLHVNKAYTTIHSYPYTRTQMFNSHILSGICLLIVPILFNEIIILIINSLAKSAISNTDIVNWFIKLILTTIAIYIISCFIGMVVGSSLWQLIFTYIFLILPTGLIVLIKFFLSLFMYGYKGSEGVDYVYLSPLLMEFDNRSTIPFIIYCIIFYLLSLYLYNKRHLENSTKLICFPIFQEVFKYGVTFCTMLVVSFSYLIEFNETYSIVILLIAAVFASFIGYYIAEMLLRKKINVFRYYKGFVIYCIVMISVIGLIESDVTGYERRVPNIDEVSNIEYEYHNFVYYNNASETQTYKTKENIQTIINMHKKIIEKRPIKQTSFQNYSWNGLTIKYTLSNGKKMKRVYDIKDNDYITYLNALYNSEEFKHNYYEVFKDNEEENIINIMIRPNVKNKPIIVKNSEEIRELVSLMKKEIASENYEGIRGTRDIGYIKFQCINESGHLYDYQYELRNNYKDLLMWLEEKDYLKDIVIMPEDINTMAISFNGRGYNTELFKNIDEEKYLYIKDKEKIQQVLNSRVTNRERYDNVEKIHVLFQSKNDYDNVYTFYISSIRAPKFVLDEYNKMHNN
jgi:ABC-2 type transport system permease protein